MLYRHDAGDIYFLSLSDHLIDFRKLYFQHPVYAAEEKTNMKNYIQKLRSRIGQEKIIHPAARIIIEDQDQRFLLLRRKDNGNYGIPAGAMEEGETIEECICREVREETGLEITQLKVIGISSDPEMETVEYHNGDIIQYFTVEFYSNQWRGTMKSYDTQEIVEVRFAERDMASRLPLHERGIFRALEHFQVSGSILLR